MRSNAAAGSCNERATPRFSSITWSAKRSSRCCRASSRRRSSAAGARSCRQGSDERLAAIDLALWTYKEDSFLAHGTAKDGHAAEQPVYLTTGGDTPNGAGVRFLVDGAESTDFTGYVRIVYMFDGNDADAVARARAQWTAAKAAGCPVTYWQQSPAGKWEKKG